MKGVAIYVNKGVIYELNEIYGGIQVRNRKNVVFNWNSDDKDADVLSLVEDTSGEKDIGPVRVTYGYKYNEGVPEREIKLVRNLMKEFGKSIADHKNVDKFVENAVLRLDELHPLSDFAVAVCTDSSTHPSLVDVMGGYIAEYSESAMASVTLIKETYENVQFDAEKAKKAMENSDRNYDSMFIHNQIVRTVHKFNELKESGELFKMEKFVPRELRDGFSSFLKFGSEKERKLYTDLQGVNVLIYDDFLTSGTTLKEVVRVLQSIHNKNTLTAFVLVKQ